MVPSSLSLKVVSVKALPHSSISSSNSDKDLSLVSPVVIISLSTEPLSSFEKSFSERPVSILSRTSCKLSKY